MTLLAFESANDVWGRADNPHVTGFSPGGSTGGEAALLALGGSRLGVGTDVAGSVRVPAHFSGIYTIKATSGRFLRAGNATPMVRYAQTDYIDRLTMLTLLSGAKAGQEGVPAVYSPMCRSLQDLEFFWKAVSSMRPWDYDQSVCIRSARNRDHLFVELIIFVPSLHTVCTYSMERDQARAVAKDRCFIR